ncbi:AMP-binding protein [Nocardia sp. 2]|uniref:AMP-binding protein n=1 Tax=Nocardia acididurans TaxID=2802282 RepID=A0ABS1M5P5_9NOCA|nr:AMP-binding protein [Nocardia acididurans]MBL1074438.1 AMP-binding protein [Nocardia acididurans]
MSPSTGGFLFAPTPLPLDADGVPGDAHGTALGSNGFRWRDAALPLVGSGALHPVGPTAAWRIVRSLTRFGPSIASVVALSAARYPHRAAMIDDRGTITYGELQRRSETIAAALHAAAPAAATLAVLCRNHRGFLEAAVVGAQLGCELVFLNTDLPAAQLAQILERHQPEILVHDEEYDETIAAAGYAGLRVRAWQDPAARLPDIRARTVPETAAGDSGARRDGTPDSEPAVGDTGTREVGTPDPSTLASLDSLARQWHPAPPPVRKAVRITLLTSGTSGLAKGVSRPIPARAVVEMAATAMTATRFTSRDVMVLSPPFFHGFGLATLIGAVALGATVVTRRRFDPETALADIARHRATVFIGVPVMIQRLVAVPAHRMREFRTSSLRLAVTGAAPIAPATISRFIDVFGPILVNGYGSTEAGIVSLATASDLAQAPKTAGRPALGVSVRVLRADRTPAAVGETGTIFVRGGIGYHGYVADRNSPAHTKEVVDGHVNTGDMGYLDAVGRLYIDGRDDDMIVSGGENIYPKEVEDVLADHPAVADVVVIGVPDEEYGQVLRAYLVPAPGTPIPAAADLVEHIRQRLERYKVPKEFVVLDQIPRNPSGKILRRELESRTRHVAG